MKVRCHLQCNLTYLKKNPTKWFNNTALFCKWKNKVGREKVTPQLFWNSNSYVSAPGHMAVSQTIFGHSIWVFLTV